MTASLLFLFHSASTSMTCCFKNLMTLCLTLSLLLMMFRGVQLLPVFMREAGHFSLMFSISFSLSVSIIDTFQSPLTTEAFNGAEGRLLVLMRVLMRVQVFICEVLVNVRACEVIEEVKEVKGRGEVCTSTLSIF